MKILLAIDGSKHSEAALHMLARLPLRKSSEVTLLTVVEPVKSVFAEKQPFIGRHVREAFQLLRTRLHQGAEHVLEREERYLAGKGFILRRVIREGHAAEEILKASKSLAADLLLMGSRGIGEFQALFLGSVSQQLIRQAPCSVLIVKSAEVNSKSGRAPAPSAPADSGSRLRILLAYDGSASSLTAVRMLRSLPLENRATVNVLAVVPELSQYGLDSSSLRLLTEVWEKEKEAARVAAEKAAKELVRAVPDVETQICEGDAAEQIMRTAEEMRADIIVVGAKGKSAVEKFFLGSVSAHVAHKAPCSVWIVRP